MIILLFFYFILFFSLPHRSLLASPSSFPRLAVGNVSCFRLLVVKSESRSFPSEGNRIKETCSATEPELKSNKVINSLSLHTRGGWDGVQCSRQAVHVCRYLHDHDRYGGGRRDMWVWVEMQLAVCSGKGR